MKLWLIAVGKPGRLLEEAIAEYEARARRYWPLEVVQVREERAGRGTTDEQVRAAETERLLKRIPQDTEIVALTRSGEAWGSEQLARHLQRATIDARAGITFVIGGAFGLSDDLLGRAQRRMRLSTFTMPHDLARLVLVEQFYRAGTIARGEPYHKGREES